MSALASISFRLFTIETKIEPDRRVPSSIRRLARSTRREFFFFSIGLVATEFVSWTAETFTLFLHHSSSTRQVDLSTHEIDWSTFSSTEPLFLLAGGGLRMRTRLELFLPSGCFSSVFIYEISLQKLQKYVRWP